MPPFAGVYDPSELNRRRTAARSVRARRRRAAAGGVALLIGAAVAAVAVSGSGSSGRASSAAQAPAPAAVAGRPTQAGAYAAVRRLASYGLPVYCAGRSKPLVALTFDDGPGPYTRLVLLKLRLHHARATFFLVGRSIRNYPGLARIERPVAAVGDHTLTHPFLPALAPSAMQQEIAGAKTLIEQASGQPVALFRPPYGGRDAAIDSEAQRLGLLEVIWTVDSADSLGANYAGIERNVINGLHPGSIILMHENRGQTVRALLAIFAALQAKHLRAVTLPELLAADPPTLAQLRAGGRGCGVASTVRGGG
jgi:peptidoglycan/xylan/chitin deacetylase (PgdA/CDA1 family)